MNTDKETEQPINTKFATLRTHALRKNKRSQAELLDNIQQRRFFNPKIIDAPDSTTLLREDRER